jgi:hypothetical protein
MTREYSRQKDNLMFQSLLSFPQKAMQAFPIGPFSRFEYQRMCHTSKQIGLGLLNLTQKI